MENASKALLIAGSVLIAIVLIAVGIKILSSTSGVTEQVGKVSTVMEASIFNSQFTQYEGQIKGSQLKSLLNAVRINNKKNTNRQITIWLGDVDEFSNATDWNTKEEFLNETISEVKLAKIYTVTIENYDEYGYIYKIFIDD